MNSLIAVHVVETVKMDNPYCGGPTKLGILAEPQRPPIIPPNGALNPLILETFSMLYKPPIILRQADTEEIVQMVSEVNNETKQKRGEVMRAALQKRTEKRMKELMADFEKVDLYPEP